MSTSSGGCSSGSRVEEMLGSPEYAKGADVVRCLVGMAGDDILDVAFVTADRDDENDRDMGRLAVFIIGDVGGEGPGSSKSRRGSDMYDAVSSAGSGWTGGRGGIGKLTTGPSVTCRK